METGKKKKKKKKKMDCKVIDNKHLPRYLLYFPGFKVDMKKYIYLL